MAEEERIYKVTVSCLRPEPPQVCGIREAFSCCGIAERDIAEETQGGDVRVSLFIRSGKKARALGKQLRRYVPEGAEISCSVLREKEWLTKWKEDFRPLKLTSRFRVVPLDEKNKYRGKNNIYIDTDRAFGTGLHPTTRFMAGFIEEKKDRCRDFFDIGTGTGILSILAVKSGMGGVWAIDIDRAAVETAAGNFAVNRCAVEYLAACDFRVFRKRREFDFVAANLFTRDLVKFRDKLLSYVRPGKYLAVSGISLHNYSFFRENFDTCRIRCLRSRKEQGWCACLYRRSSS